MQPRLKQVRKDMKAIAVIIKTFNARICQMMKAIDRDQNDLVRIERMWEITMRDARNDIKAIEKVERAIRRKYDATTIEDFPLGLPRKSARRILRGVREQISFVRNLRPENLKTSV